MYGDKNDEIKINLYEMIISYDSFSKEEALQLFNNIYNLFPKSAILTATEIYKIEGMTPNIINKLSPNQCPGLSRTVIKALLREIVYDK